MSGLCSISSTEVTKVFEQRSDQIRAWLLKNINVVGYIGEEKTEERQLIRGNSAREGVRLKRHGAQEGTSRRCWFSAP